MCVPLKCSHWASDPVSANICSAKTTLDRTVKPRQPLHAVTDPSLWSVLLLVEKSAPQGSIKYHINIPKQQRVTLKPSNQPSCHFPAHTYKNNHLIECILTVTVSKQCVNLKCQSSNTWHEDNKRRNHTKYRRIHKKTLPPKALYSCIAAGRKDLSKLSLLHYCYYYLTLF